MICRADLYRGHLLPIETQESILALARTGMAHTLISRELGINRQVVNQVIENGFVLIMPLAKPKRCGCGAKLVAYPCLSCQLKQRTKT
jgi:hypothetical protein